MLFIFIVWIKSDFFAVLFVKTDSNPLFELEYTKA